MFWRKRQPAEIEAERVANIIRKQLSRLGMTATVKRGDAKVTERVEFVEPIIARPDSILLRVDIDDLPTGITLTDLSKPEILDTLSTACGHRIEIERPKGAGFWYAARLNAAANERIPKLVKLRDMKPPANASAMCIPLGGSADGLVWDDLRDLPHLLIAGATGQGKSVMVNAILCWLAARLKPSQLKMILVDLKGGMELGLYEDLPHCLQLVTRAIDLPAVLATLQQEMDRRTRLMRGNSRDIDEYNRQADADKQLPYLLLVIDEVANAMLSKERVRLEMADGSTRVGTVKSETEALLADLAARARATGIHLIISTQRPSVDVVTGLIKANFPARIALGTASDVDSRVIIDHPGAAGLAKGRMLFRRNMDLVAIQGAYISTEDVRKWVKLVIAGKIEIKSAGQEQIELCNAVITRAHELGQYSVSKLFHDAELNAVGIGEYKIRQATELLARAGVIKSSWRRGRYSIVGTPEEWEKRLSKLQPPTSNRRKSPRLTA